MFTQEALSNPNTQWLVAEVVGDASETALVKFFQPIEDIRTTKKSHEITK